ncbi:hypothetical protein IGL98_001359 [Enterococcus sp. DIV0840]|uniref:Uncharacterized protein n=1 Tax=Enterococcus ureasiticus TaxID=903984 RepID=A0A1E5GMX3_9ENTE|nr:MULTISPECIES: hypothetical protein [Enterococcus]MBO0434887.1 hypothetical protein [Enterococcus sp. DIV0849a]OEG14059.1 hypothetical protein BCR21_03445 [Enterococcus ureasiticus]
MNKYYFIARELHEFFYVAKKQTFKEHLGENANKKIIIFVLFLIVSLAIAISNSVINNSYFRIISALILITFLYILRNVLNKTTLIDIVTMNDNYREQIHSFSEALHLYGFDSKFIEQLIIVIQENIKKKEKKNENRSRYTFQLSLVLFGVIGFFSKELWTVLDVSSIIKKDILNSSLVIIIIVLFLFYGLFIYRVINDPKVSSYSDEERVLNALQEVLMYREKKKIL